MARLTLILGVLATVIGLFVDWPGVLRFGVNEWRNWRNKGTWLAVLGLCLMPSMAEAGDCNPFCQNVSAVGNGTEFVDVSITTSGNNHLLVVAVRNGAGSSLTNSSITNTGLSWILEHHRDGWGWGHDLYCVIAPSAGVQDFRVNTEFGAVGIRVLVEEYTEGLTCPASHIASARGVISTVNSGNFVTTTTALIVAAGATDGDTNGDLAGWVAGSGFTIRNPNCNTGLEPDQKVCIEDKGIQASGTYAGTFELLQADAWDVIAASYDAAPSSSSPAVVARVLRWMEVAAFVTGMGWHFRKQVMAVSLAALAGCGTLYQLAPRSYETVKVVSKDSALKVLTVFNHLTKPRI